MKQKAFRILNKIYAVMMFISFFAGALPILPFIVALFLGGESGPALYSFLFSDYYPWVMALGSLSILVGTVAMYVGKVEDLSLKSIEKKEKQQETTN